MLQIQCTMGRLGMSAVAAATVALALALALLVPAQAQAGPWDASLHMVSPSLVQQFNAVCLDGSSPGAARDPGHFPTPV